MIKEIDQLLSVRTRRMEWFDACTFDFKRRTTWNLNHQTQIWRLSTALIK